MHENKGKKRANNQAHKPDEQASDRTRGFEIMGKGTRHLPLIRRDFKSNSLQKFEEIRHTIKRMESSRNILERFEEFKCPTSENNTSKGRERCEKNKVT